MRKFANRLIAMLFFLVPFTSFAQTSISGRVVNDKDGTPVVGATIFVKGAKTGTKTDANGNFTVTANKGDVLVISSVSFVPQQIKVKDAGNVTINLARADVTMDEVVVTAMDIKKKSTRIGIFCSNCKRI